MALALTDEQMAIAQGSEGAGAAMTMRIVADTARLMGAPRLIPIASAHIDGALYHGDSGTLFAEKLVEGSGKVKVRSTLNVGALDLMGCSKQRMPPAERDMAKRMMMAYEAMGCEPSWTCSPYQAGHRPALGSDVAWGEGCNGPPSRLFKVKSKNRKACRRIMAKAGRRASKAACAEGS